MALYLAGLACLALVTGAIAGLSQSPVVATILPLIFGLLGTVGSLALPLALLMGKGDKAEGNGEQPRRFRPDPAGLALSGLALAVFSIALFAGSVYGIAIRTGASADAFVPFRHSPDPVPISGNAQDDLAIAILDRMLGGMGVAGPTRSSIINGALDNCPATRDAVRSAQQELAAKYAVALMAGLIPQVPSLDAALAAIDTVEVSSEAYPSGARIQSLLLALADLIAVLPDGDESLAATSGKFQKAALEQQSCATKATALLDLALKVAGNDKAAAFVQRAEVPSEAKMQMKEIAAE